MHVCKDEWCLLAIGTYTAIFLPIYWFKNSLSMLSVQARGFKVWGWVNICVLLPFQDPNVEWYMYLCTYT